MSSPEIRLKFHAQVSHIPHPHFIQSVNFNVHTAPHGLPTMNTPSPCAAKVPTKGMAAYASTTFFQPHRAREAIRDAHAKTIPPLMGYYAGISSIPNTRFLAPMGFDAVWIDWEHSSCNVETMTTMVHDSIFMSGGRTIPFVRVPGHDHASIGYALDAGASLIIPQVETVSEAKHVISAAKFNASRPSVPGTRSAPPFRYIIGVTDQPYDPARTLHECLNDQAAIMIQVESLAGIENLDSILAECGSDIDMVWFGSLDCRVSMGLPGNSGLGGAEPEWLAAAAKFREIIDKHDKPYAGFGFSGPPFGAVEGFVESAERMSMMMMAADVLAFMGMGNALQEAKALVAPLVQRAGGKNGETTNGKVVEEKKTENGEAIAAR
ncbi:uncharacterized protein MKZ38_002144 [Zalerion maritima]|uniref:HpcH/HpaI aldolase/citrate lyase domain-containing protein n=1 Tax=Zalerion maritima TaxID=339359 RepID=A0AAD5WSN1_9PEZI|nr:uncharacterized protein MKZ38_002144 [Zalerion maritima]